MSSLGSLVDQIVRELRAGPNTFRVLQVHLNPTDDRKLDRALQKAKRDGLIEYSQVGEDRRRYWRLVERKPAQKVGPEMAGAICNGEPHLFKSAFDRAHKLGFGDGQTHAFQVVADKIRAKIAADAQIGCSPSVDDLAEWADEIEAGAWSEPSDET